MKKIKLMGRKLGMTARFDAAGKLIPCTVIEIAPNVVTQIKTVAKEGCNTLQLGAIPCKKKALNKPQLVAQEKIGMDPRRHNFEFKLEPNEVDTVKVGELFTVTRLVECLGKLKLVDVAGVSKGKGYQGLMRRNHFKCGHAAHGASNHNHVGSTGQRTDPGECFKGSPRASQLGGYMTTIQSLEVFEVNAEKNLLYIKGAVPGANQGFVWVSKSVKHADCK